MSSKSAASGYSGTPLAKKLGLKPGFRINIVNQPDYYYELFSDLPLGIREVTNRKAKKNFIHYFVTDANRLKRDIKGLRREMEEDGMIWVSWPKKSAKLETDLDENVVRNIALSNGLVDVKVCAVDEVWSGLKLVVRLKDRAR